MDMKMVRFISDLDFKTWERKITFELVCDTHGLVEASVGSDSMMPMELSAANHIREFHPRVWLRDHAVFPQPIVKPDPSRKDNHD